MSDATPTILIVDDVPTNIHILGDTLASDYRLRIATNGPDALKLAAQCRPDLILLDIMMPGMDGFEVMRRLRLMEEVDRVPVIFVTALEGARVESQGLELGAADFISKPYDPEVVRLRVRNHLELARQRTLLREQRDELERQIRENQSVREQVKRLEGIIPICMCCKKIRDDEDSWQQLENYISDHTEAVFSHGICPHCAEEQLGHTTGTRHGAAAEAALPGRAEAEAAFRALCDASPLGIFLADPRGSNLFSNPRLEEITGRSARGLAGLGFEAAIHPEDRRELHQFWGAALSSGRPWSHEPRLATRRGIKRVRILAIPLIEPGGTCTGFVGTVDDITNLSQARKEIEKIQKLEALGLMASGIAHDFNNILTGILGNLSLAQVQIEPASVAQVALQEAERASERAVQLSRQLLTVAKGGETVHKAVPVRHLVSEAVSLALRGTNVQGVIEVPEEIHAVEVDEEQMIQALSNIAINAAQAMPEGGRLTVRAEELHLGPGNGLGLGGGQYVALSIADEGCGIPESCKWKVFDPYFSTKPGCTGLGLSSTYSIVSKHQGHVGVESRPGAGTVVTVHLPSTREEREAGVARQKAQGLNLERSLGGSILVMDDEEMIRTISEKMLECLGYQVTTCADGAEAIELYCAAAASGKRYDAVIMDLTVAGGMGGKVGAQHLLAFDPDARLIVSSGYCNDPVMTNYRDYGFCSVLAKPYKANDLAQVLSQALSGHPTP